MRKPEWSLTVHDPRLDPLRHALAEMSYDGKPVGYLATRVEAMTTHTGRMWWKKWSTPWEFVVCEYERTDPDSPLPPWGDPWFFPDVDLDTIEELCAGRYEDADHRVEALRWEEQPMVTYSLRWLAGEEYDALWPRYGVCSPHER